MRKTQGIKSLNISLDIQAMFRKEKARINRLLNGEENTTFFQTIIKSGITLSLG